MAEWAPSEVGGAAVERRRVVAAGWTPSELVEGRGMGERERRLEEGGEDERRKTVKLEWEEGRELGREVRRFDGRRSGLGGPKERGL